MNDTGKSIADLLNEFVLATDEEVDGALERLFRDGIEPSASAVIKHKLGISMRADDQDHVNQIGLDLLSGVKSSLLPLLKRVRDGADSSVVENFNAYVRAAASNAFRQFLRDKYPNRLRLRNKLRYILTRRKPFAFWKDDSGTAICGLALWHDGQIQPIRAAALEILQVDISSNVATHGDPDDNHRIVELIKEIFELATAPLIFEDLVSVTWHLLGLREAQNVSEDDHAFDTLSSKVQNIEERFDDRALIEHIWSKLGLMPLRHRRALLLNLRDDKGNDLLSLFPVLGVASVRQVAAILEFEPEELAAVWNRLPLDDLAIAERMGLTRQQVINLRQSARASLRRGLNR